MQYICFKNNYKKINILYFIYYIKIFLKTSTIENHMNIIEKRTQINPKVIIGGLAIALILTTTKIFSSYVTCLVGVLCPTYLSLKALESPEEDDDKHFLTYWVVYGLFTIFDIFTSFLINRIPFYYTLKLAFLIWMFMPNFKGSLFIYNYIIGPLFKKYESKFDKGVAKILKKGENLTDKAIDTFEENANKILKGPTILKSKQKKIE